MDILAIPEGAINLEDQLLYVVCSENIQERRPDGCYRLVHPWQGGLAHWPYEHTWSTSNDWARYEGVDLQWVCGHAYTWPQRGQVHEHRAVGRRRNLGDGQ